jgi:nucleoside-diphosphate-sugar epimerase
MTSNPRHILVIGASGFIGRRVACRLREKEIPHTCAGRKEADILVPGQLENLMGEVRPDVVLNLIGYGVDPRERDPESCAAINTHLPERLARCLAAIPSEWPGTRLVSTGSALEYGPLTGELSEERESEPNTLYGRTKLAGTRGLAEASAATGVLALTARLFTVYGPGERAGRLVPSLLDTAKTGKPLPLTAGLHRRDFTYVDDVAEGMLRLTEVCTSPGAVVNLATGHPQTVKSFVLTAAHLFGIPAERLNFDALPTRSEEVLDFCVPVEKLTGLTGWRPTTGIEEGLQRTWENTQ